MDARESWSSSGARSTKSAADSAGFGYPQLSAEYVVAANPDVREEMVRRHGRPEAALSVEGLRREGRLGLLARALVSQAWVGVQLGTWSVAVPAAEEGLRLSVTDLTWHTVGRTIFADAAKAWFAGTASEEETVAKMAQKFGALVAAWEEAK